MQMGGWRNAHGEGRKMYNLLGTHTYRDKTEVHIKVVPTKKIARLKTVAKGKNFLTRIWKSNKSWYQVANLICKS